MEITGRNGAKKEVVLGQFSAMDGWDLQLRFKEFAASQDPKFKRRYTYEILAYAQVKVGTNLIPLSTDALVDNHLEKWENIKLVFEGVLAHNGIDAQTHADSPHFWANAGAEMAVAFIAQTTALIGPALKLAEANKE